MKRRFDPYFQIITIIYFFFSQFKRISFGESLIIISFFHRWWQFILQHLHRAENHWASEGRVRATRMYRAAVRVPTSNFAIRRDQTREFKLEAWVQLTRPLQPANCQLSSDVAVLVEDSPQHLPPVATSSPFFTKREGIDAL